MTQVAERAAAVRDAIGQACDRAGRPPGDVTLIAVGKTFPAHVLVEAFEAGLADLGENRAQELREKATVIPDARWHFIGPLQTNKVRQVVGVASLIHSVDRIALGAAVARRARSRGMVQDVLIEVNIAGEVSKSGAEPAAVETLARELSNLEGIRVRGLMTIPPLTPDPEQTRPYFRDLSELRDRLTVDLPEASHLSMGMSRDFEAAIEEGATLVRVGEAIFGSRNR